MTAILNQYKAAIPGKYEQYLGPYLYEPYALYTTGRIKGAPKKVLEMAAGTGRVTRAIAEKIGKDARLIATDLNPNMLAIAERQVKRSNVEFLIADAQALPFEDNQFDCVICQFGFMFLPDRQQGFNEAWRVLKPGGQFLFVTWDQAENNSSLHISQQTVVRYLQEAPPPYYARPYSMHKPAELEKHLENAGFKKASIENIKLKGTCARAMDAATGFVEGNSIVLEILKDGEDLLATIKAEIVEKINAQLGKDPFCSTLSAWFGEAFK